MSLTPSRTSPAFDASQLSLPDLLDFELEKNPKFALYVFAEEGSSDITTISMLEFVRAAHRVGNAICGDSQPGDVVAVVANIDAIVYTAVIAGIMKVGLVPFPISPRNTPAALLHLIRRSSAHRLLTTKATLQAVLDGLEEEIQLVDPSYALSVEEVPDLHTVYPCLGKETAEDPFTPISRPSSPKDSDKGLYLHSSGSTGLPKPILLTHQIIKDNAALLFHRAYHQAVSRPLLGAFGLPPFHIMGVSYQLLMPLYGLISTGMFRPAVTSPSAVPLIATAEKILEAVKVVKPNIMITVPSFLHAWSQSDDATEVLSNLVALIYGGGPLAPRIADALRAKGVNVHSLYGGTEFSIITTLRLDFEDWQYMGFSERTNIRWVAQGDGTFEAQFLARIFNLVESKTHRLALKNIPDSPGYATSDVWEPHATIPGLWKIVGRIDDVLIHSSGEKTVPAPIEAVISASPILNGVLMFGRQRDQPGVLLEPAVAHQIDVNDDTEVARFRNLIWPVVEEANKVAPAFSRIFKETILIADPKKPLPRVGKGNIAKKAAAALYAAEIDKLYEVMESNMGGESVEPPKSWDAADVQTWLVAQITDIMSGASINPNVDLFEQGLDSLSATIVRLRLVGALRRSNVSAVASRISQNIVYTYPTVEQLTDCIVNLVSGKVFRQKTHEELMEEMIAKYSQFDAPVPAPASEIDPNRQYVLLTGSTGALGAQLLASLLMKGNVERVYALNRPSARATMLERHRERFQDKALDTSLLSLPKLVFLEGEASHEGVGLSEEILNELRQNLTMIIHNAWRVDFNLALSSFEPHIKGSRILMDLARSSRHSSFVRYLFTSSVTSAQSWDAHALGPYPEEVIMNAKYAVGGGYGESKYVTERILAKSGLHGTSFRIGQVAGGDPNGAWSTTDWVPIIVKSSLHIGMLPDAYGVVSWVPMDAVSDALLDVGFTPGKAPIAVNVVHPKPTPWTFVMQSLRTNLINERHLASDALPLVPYHEWIANVQKYAVHPTEDDLQNIPAVKLVNFLSLQAAVDDGLRKNSQTTFESAGLTPLRTENVQELSERMRALKPLDAANTEKWVRYWANAGFLN